MRVSALQGLNLAEDMEQQTTAVRKQMLSMFVFQYFRLDAFCSCFTLKSFKTNKQMATDYYEATAPSVELSSVKLAYNQCAKFTF